MPRASSLEDRFALPQAPPRTQFIVYACPTGELATQLDRYFAASRSQCGANAAHRYMPHITLTGFFAERANTVPKYIQALDRWYRLTARSRPDPVVTITALQFAPDWHGLTVASPWLEDLMVKFACSVASPTRKEPIRVKRDLHLSLADEFAPNQATALTDLAQTHVDPHAPVGWELRFYQRQTNQRWLCHQTWPL